MSDPVQADFRAAIARHFSYLFHDGGFVFVAEMNERLGEYQMQIVASADCQIKFILEQDSISLYFGRADAPRSWENEEGGVTAWHFADMLMAFEDHIHPSQAVHLPSEPEGAALDGVLRTYAQLVRAYLPRLAEAFSNAPQPGWWPAYEAFKAARIAAVTPT